MTINVAILYVGDLPPNPWHTLMKISSSTAVRVVLVMHVEGDLCTQLASKQVNVIVLYSMFFDLDVLVYLKDLKQLYPHLGLALVTDNLSVQNVRMAYQEGVSACLSCNSTSLELTIAIMAISKGDRYLSPQWGQAVVSAYIAGAQISDTSDLSGRQREILRLLVKGHSCADVAELLAISTKTVESHRSKIMKKLKADNLVSLVHRTYREELCINSQD